MSCASRINAADPSAVQQARRGVRQAFRALCTGVFVFICSSGAVTASPEVLPALSKVARMCTDPARSFDERLAAFEALGFEQTDQMPPTHHAAQAASIGLLVHGRFAPYKESGAKSQFRNLYDPDRKLMSFRTDLIAGLTHPNAKISVTLHQTEKGLRGCDIALGPTETWDAIDIEPFGTWPTEAGTRQSFEPRGSNKRVDVVTFTDLWRAWFDLTDPPGTWIMISAKPEEVSG